MAGQEACLVATGSPTAATDEAASQTIAADTQNDFVMTPRGEQEASREKRQNVDRIRMRVCAGARFWADRARECGIISKCEKV
jgi:hypothetical protein